MFKLASLAAVAVATATLGSMGCSKGAAPPKTAASDVDQGRAGAAGQSSSQQAVGKAVQENQGGGLNISAEIMALCPGIKPPEFGFDSAQLRSDWHDALKTLAACMESGGLNGRSVLLTGHTDPRGEDDYNMELGGRRASAVKQAIEVFGVSGGRLDVTSRGKVDAQGTDEATWARDRRVDISLEGKGAASGVSSR